MMTKSSPHVHTTYCDGKSTAREMVEAALALGFVSLGFSSHALQDFELEYAMTEQGEQDYLKEVRGLQAEYAGRLRIWLGMERDSLSIADRAQFAYVLGSVHYLRDHQGLPIAVDGPPDLVRELIDNRFEGSGIALAEEYYAQLGRYIREYKPDIIGHFDIVTKHNARHQFFDVNSLRYERAASDALEEAILGCNLLEVNTGAIARSGAASPYPDLKLLKYWQALGGQVILASDCHRAEQMDAGYAQGAALIRQAGYKKAAILGRQDELFEYVPVD